ncbi:MAG TPA: condensation domain-containing protein, partial [Terriglobales bacterium]|nr:condensation domain-containing protein [Terriglobales bacterium]
LKPGGRIFIGDNRSLPLLEAFHTAVQLYQAPDSLSREQLYQRVQKRMSQDEELVIDPGFFHALKHRIPQISRAEMQVKRARHRNEMSEFRYDAVLQVGEDHAAPVDCTWLNWQKERLSLTDLRRRLSEENPEVLAVTRVPNAKVAAAVDALHLLRNSDGPATVAELKPAVQQMSVRNAVEPDDLWALADELSYDVKVSWPAGASDGCLNVVYRRRNGKATDWAMPSAPGEPNVYGAVDAYANNPMAVAISRNLLPQLRRLASAKLPEYMVPSAFVILDKLPLTENGKVDRRALPAPDQSRPEMEKGYVAPRTPVEEMLASIWADVLRLERVGVGDDFFELGGHSLNATQVVSRVRDAFRVEFPLRALFETPTVEGLAKTIEGLQRGQHGAQAPPMTRAPRDREIPLSFAQQRLWFLDQMDPGNWLYNVPRAMRLNGPLNVEAMERALNDLIARHEILRTTYEVVNDHPVQKIAAHLVIDLPLIDLIPLPAGQREEQARRIVQEEAARGFNLSVDPILRGTVIRLDKEDHVLFLNTHHIASDGWSTGVMMNELATLYQSALQNKPAELPELKIQYADYALWQRNWLQGEVLEKQLAYWKAELEGAPPVLSLPTDRPRPAKQSLRGALYDAVLPGNLVDGLRILGRQQGSTLFMTMLAGFETLLHYYTGQPDLVLGTDLANRPTVETEALIGFFVNLLVLRTDVSGNPTFEELIGRVREVSLRAYAHQDLPFDKLVEQLRPERNLTHSPLVQVLFVQQNTPRSASGIPGLKMAPFRLEVPSKFDMALFMNETGNEVIGRWVYNPDLFDASSIARMASSYELVLRSALVDPKMRLGAFCELLASAEKQMRGSEQKKFQQAGLEKLKKIRRKVIAEV